MTDDNRARNRLLCSTHALIERAAAELKQRRWALKHTTLSPGHIRAIIRAALVLNSARK